MATPHGSGPLPVWQDAEPRQPYERPVPPAAARPGGRGPFGSLFEFRFDGLIAPKLVKLLYDLLLILLTIGALVQVVGAFGVMASESVPLGLLWLVLAPVFWLLGLVVYRGLLQLMIVIFKITGDR